MPTPITKSKKKAWAQFSTFIRTRDCLDYKRHHPELNNGLEAPCVTCRRVYPLASLQAGHFIPGRTNAVLFDERGVHAQCYGCNVGKNGNYHEYWLYMENMYGRKVLDELMSQRHAILKLKASDYDEIALRYKEKTIKLLGEQ